jgi:hypothetical protein
MCKIILCINVVKTLAGRNARNHERKTHSQFLLPFYLSYILCTGSEATFASVGGWDRKELLELKIRVKA